MAGRRPTAKEGLALAVAGAAAFGYPVAVSAALERFDVRAVAAAVLVLALLTTGARRAVEGRPWRTLLLQAAPGLGLLGAAAATDDGLWLRLFPALVNAYLAFAFAWTLGTERSMVERGAVFLQPHMPDFTRPYCRRLTALWAAFFAANAVGIALLAARSPETWWPLYASRLYFAIVGVLSVAEFFVRKIHFRHYSDRPVDRLFDAVFPAENTERGRRSAAYLDRMRALGLKSD